MWDIQEIVGCSIAPSNKNSYYINKRKWLLMKILLTAKTSDGKYKKVVFTFSFHRINKCGSSRCFYPNGLIFQNCCLVESWYSLRVLSRISRRSERRRVVFRGPSHGFWGWDAITQVQGRSTHREWHHPLNTHPMYYSPLPEWSVRLLVKIRYFTTQNSVSRLFILNCIRISYLQWIFYSKWNLLSTY